MISRRTRFAAASSLVGLACLSTAAVAYASPGATPHMVPASTKITAALAKGTKFIAVGNIDGFAITVTCTAVAASGKTPANGLTANLSKPPKFSGCTDSLGGTDTVVTAGKWSVTLNSTGTAGSLNVPKDAATFKSSILSSCVVTVDPNGSTKVAGTYNDQNTLTITNQNLPVSGSGCTTSPNTTVSSTVMVHPNVMVVG